MYLKMSQITFLMFPLMKYVSLFCLKLRTVHFVWSSLYLQRVFLTDFQYQNGKQVDINKSYLFRNSQCKTAPRWLSKFFSSFLVLKSGRIALFILARSRRYGTRM